MSKTAEVSAPLGVLDHYAEIFAEDGRGAQAVEIVRVRNAVATLVEACREKDKAADQLGLAEEFFEWGDKEIVDAQKALDKAVKAYRAALAAFSEVR